MSPDSVRRDPDGGRDHYRAYAPPRPWYRRQLQGPPPLLLTPGWRWRWPQVRLRSRMKPRSRVSVRPRMALDIR